MPKASTNEAVKAPTTPKRASSTTRKTPGYTRRTPSKSRLSPQDIAKIASQSNHVHVLETKKSPARSKSRQRRTNDDDSISSPSRSKSRTRSTPSSSKLKQSDTNSDNTIVEPLKPRRSARSKIPSDVSQDDENIPHLKDNKNDNHGSVFTIDDKSDTSSDTLPVKRRSSKKRQNNITHDDEHVKEPVKTLSKRTTRKNNDKLALSTTDEICPNGTPNETPNNSTNNTSPSLLSHILSHLTIILVVIFYFITSISTVLFNKLLFVSELKKHTIFVTWVQLVFTSLVTLLIEGIKYVRPIISNYCKSSSKSSLDLSNNKTQSIDNDTTRTSSHNTPLHSTSLQLSTCVSVSSYFEPIINVLFNTLWLSILFSLMLLTSNYSLSYVNVSFYQVARSWTIIFSVILSYLCSNVTPTRIQIVSCLVVVCGYIMACYGELDWVLLSNDFYSLYNIIVLKSRYIYYFIILPLLGTSSPEQIHSTAAAVISTMSPSNVSNPIQLSLNTQFPVFLGLLIGGLSSLVLAYYSIVTKNTLKKTNISPNIVVLSTNITASILLGIIMLFTGELSTALNMPELYSTHIILYLLCVSLAGYMLSYANMLQIKYTSALGHNISGTAKASVQSIIGWYIFGNNVSILTCIGTAITIIGCGAYALLPLWLSSRQQQQQQQQQQQHQTIQVPANKTTAIATVAK